MNESKFPGREELAHLAAVVFSACNEKAPADAVRESLKVALQIRLHAGLFRETPIATGRSPDKSELWIVENCRRPSHG